MIECVQYYFQNTDNLIGTSELSDEQKAETLKVMFGSNLLRAALTVQLAVDTYGKIKVKDVHDLLEIGENDSKIMGRFKDCYERLTVHFLVRNEEGKGEKRVGVYKAVKNDNFS